MSTGTQSTPAGRTAKQSLRMRGGGGAQGGSKPTPEDPGFLVGDDGRLLRGEAGWREERRKRAFRVEGGIGAGGEADLGGVADAYFAGDGPGEERGVDFGEHDRGVGDGEAGVEGPGGDAVEARVVEQTVEGGEAHEHLTADGAGGVELPGRLGGGDASFHQPALGERVDAVAAAFGE